MERKETFRGMILNFQKKAIYSASEKENDFYMFGYYDGLDILNADMWLQFSPLGIEHLCQEQLKQDVQESMSHSNDSYAVKLMLPTSQVCQTITATCGAQYWDDEEQKKIKEENPLLTITLLNLNSNFITRIKAQSERFTVCICGCIERK